MTENNLVWTEENDHYLLWLVINDNYVGLGYILDLSDRWYYKGDDGLGDIIEGTTDSLDEARRILVDHVDMTAY